MLIHFIAAARPNFMKVAPLFHALKEEPWAELCLVHTGQHYDINMSDAFFQDLKLPDPDLHLGIGSGTHAEQTGKVLMAYEKVLLEKRPDLVIVVGDVNSTAACTLAASKIQYPQPKQTPADTGLPASRPSSLGLSRRPLVAHLEAGLRSFDRSMPEEINRLVTDALADILWTPSADADENLLREGVAPEKIQRVGNIMIDSLEMLRGVIEQQAACRELELEPGGYGLVTLHRPSNVDDPRVLETICRTLVRTAERIPLVFPVHPRTAKNLRRHGLLSTLQSAPGLRLLEPLNYIRFMNLVFQCRLAVTDSGGIQEETTYLGIPCLTLRPNTERPVTVTQGTNQLCSAQDLEPRIEAVLNGHPPSGSVPDLWDGRTASRVVQSIKNLR